MKQPIIFPKRIDLKRSYNIKQWKEFKEWIIAYKGYNRITLIPLIVPLSNLFRNVRLDNETLSYHIMHCIYKEQTELLDYIDRGVHQWIAGLSIESQVELFAVWKLYYEFLEVNSTIIYNQLVVKYTDPTASQATNAAAIEKAVESRMMWVTLRL